MPVRIYDISKKLGLENKEVLAKAKELGIAAARVASSSLDKITAEYLEQQLVLAYPERTAPSSPPPPAPVEAGPTQVVELAPHPPSGNNTTHIPEQPIHVHEVTTSTTTSTALTEARPELPPSPPVMEVPAAKTPEPPRAEEPVAKIAPPAPAPAPPPVAPPPPPPPPPPPESLGPKLGDKVGFIHLPPKPGPKLPDKTGAAAKAPLRGPELRRGDPGRRGEIRSVRGAAAPTGPAIAGAKFPASGKAAAKAEPAAPKISAGRCPGHYHQATHRGAGFGGATETQAVPDHRRFDGVGGFCERQPGD